ncbi:MAG: hypothetical protein RJA44_18, partial [Pseudomonadota bacterium]
MTNLESGVFAIARACPENQSSGFSWGRLSAWRTRLLIFVFVLLAVWALPARAASFNWSSPTCISSVPCTSVGGITRFSGALTGATARDILVEVIAASPNAGVTTAPGNGGSYFDGEIRVDPARNAVSRVRFRLTFIDPVSGAAAPLQGPVYLSSMDTDGNGSALNAGGGGLRERIEYITPLPASLSWGSLLESATALEGGQAVHTIVCTGVVLDPLSGTNACTAAGNYPYISGTSQSDLIKASAIYTGLISSIDFGFGAEVADSPLGSSDPNINAPVNLRHFAIAGGIPDADMRPSAISCTPPTG